MNNQPLSHFCNSIVSCEQVIQEVTSTPAKYCGWNWICLSEGSCLCRWMKCSMAFINWRVRVPYVHHHRTWGVTDILRVGWELEPLSEPLIHVIPAHTLILLRGLTAVIVSRFTLGRADWSTSIFRRACQAHHSSGEHHHSWWFTYSPNNLFRNSVQQIEQCDFEHYQMLDLQIHPITICICSSSRLHLPLVTCTTWT